MKTIRVTSVDTVNKMVTGNDISQFSYSAKWSQDHGFITYIPKVGEVWRIENITGQPDAYELTTCESSLHMDAKATNEGDMSIVANHVWCNGVDLNSVSNLKPYDLYIKENYVIELQSSNINDFYARFTQVELFFNSTPAPDFYVISQTFTNVSANSGITDTLVYDADRPWQDISPVFHFKYANPEIGAVPAAGTTFLGGVSFIATITFRWNGATYTEMREIYVKGAYGAGKSSMKTIGIPDAPSDKYNFERTRGKWVQVDEHGRPTEGVPIIDTVDSTPGTAYIQVVGQNFDINDSFTIYDTALNRNIVISNKENHEGGIQLTVASGQNMVAGVMYDLIVENSIGVGDKTFMVSTSGVSISSVEILDSSSIIVHGRGFGGNQGSSTVELGFETFSIPSDGWHDDRIVLNNIDPHLVGEKEYTVTVTVGLVPVSYTFTTPSVPVIDDVSTSGTNLNIVIIRGANFGKTKAPSTNLVIRNKTSGQSLQLTIAPGDWSDKSITAHMTDPIAYSVHYGVTIETSFGNSNEKDLYVTPHAEKPKVTSVVPTPRSDGKLGLVINGEHFGTTSGVVTIIGGFTLESPVESWTDTRITCHSSGQVSPGSYSLTVSNANGVSDAFSFNVTSGIPVIDKVTSTLDSIDITGSKFGATRGQGTITITGGSEGTRTISNVSWSDTHITAKVSPEFIDGTEYGVTVTTSGGTSQIVKFTPHESAPPVITRISWSGSQFTITGTHFTTNRGTITITPSLGTVSIVSWTPTGIIFSTSTIPGDEVDYTFRVTTAVGSSNNFVWTKYQKPVISSVEATPNSLIIRGDHFGNTRGSGSVKVWTGSDTYSIGFNSWSNRVIQVSVSPNMKYNTTYGGTVTNNGGIQSDTFYWSIPEPKKPRPPKIGVYRVRNPNTEGYFWTTSLGEAQSLVRQGWTLDFNGSPQFNLFQGPWGQGDYDWSNTQEIILSRNNSDVVLESYVPSGWGPDRTLGWALSRDSNEGVPMHTYYSQKHGQGVHLYTNMPSENAAFGGQDDGIHWNSVA